MRAQKRAAIVHSMSNTRIALAFIAPRWVSIVMPFGALNAAIGVYFLALDLLTRAG